MTAPEATRTARELLTSLSVHGHRFMVSEVDVFAVAAALEAAGAERDKAQMEYQLSEATLFMAVARLGGYVEGLPTMRHNFLQRIDELVALEAAGAEARELREYKLAHCFTAPGDSQGGCGLCHEALDKHPPDRCVMRISLLEQRGELRARVRELEAEKHFWWDVFDDLLERMCRAREKASQ